MQKSVFDSKRQRLLLVLALIAGGAACKGQVRAKASVDALSGADPDASDRKYEMAATEAAPAATPALASAPPPRPPAAEPPPAPSEQTAYFGVVHDLSLAPGASRAPVCNCLAVAYGAPNDPKFAWQAEAPAVSRETLAVAIDSVACAAPGAVPVRASISGVEREGHDVVVVVENAREGLPVMRGALAAAPGPAGALVIRGRNGAPFGAPESGGRGSCRIALR